VTMRVVSIQSLKAVIERRKLEPVDGQYHLTDEMFAEAAAIDERAGRRPSPEKIAELKAVAEGRPPPNWEWADDSDDPL
jgi:hypothetical protein